MPDKNQHEPDRPYLLHTVSAISEIDSGEWDLCAGPDNPLISHAFLNALEESGAVQAQTGWMAQHFVIRDTKQRLIAAVPLYLKGHSYGEYVFDWSWAEAYERAGGRYYPKLLSAIPFTPVGGARLLVRDRIAPAKILPILVRGLKQLVEKFDCSGIHVNFCLEEELDSLAAHGFGLRHGHQFHWQNDGYANFEEFLSRLASRKRKAIRKERRQFENSGVTVRRLTGDDITSADWDSFYFFYKDTYDRKWGRPYMNRQTFKMFHEKLRHQILLVMAYEEGHAIAGALNFIGSDALYGRNWGAIVDYRFLHFELCYYQAIEFAIERKLRRVEAGTQGEHKIQRGYLPVKTCSAHYFRDSVFADAVDRFLLSERNQESLHRARLAAYSPYRQENS